MALSGVVAVLAGCSDAAIDVPQALRGVCDDQRGCVITNEVADSLCRELGDPARVELDTRGGKIRSITILETYPVVDPDRGYPVAVPIGTPWDLAIDCTAR